MSTSIRRHAGHIGALICLAILIVGFAPELDSLFSELRPKSAFDLVEMLATPQSVSLIVCACLLCVCLPVLSPMLGSLMTVLCAAAILYTAISFNQLPSSPDLRFCLTAILSLFLAHVVISYFRHSNERREMIDAFAQYVPPDIARRIGHAPSTAKLEGESVELTVMFCDIHGFTGIAEQLEPTQLTRFLNAVFTPLSEIVHQHNGTIDKFIGDSMMAFWGAPVRHPNHAANAVAAAFEIQKAIRELRYFPDGSPMPPIKIGVGINTGTASVGNMGSKYRLAYTAIGDCVNLAARIQELTRLYHAEIIVGEATRNAFPIANYREIGLVEIRGKENLVRIYEPFHPKLDPDSTVIHTLQRHNDALGYYYQRNWADAAALFKALKDADPDDRLYDYYLSQIEIYAADPPPQGWRGEIPDRRGGR